jgi:tryptophan synthase alpha subunit
MIGAGADAVIVGSAIIDKISRTPGKRTLAELRSFARSMKQVCRAR